MENKGCPSQVQGNQDQHNQKLRAENQKLRAGNQELRTRMGTVEAQMAELKKFMLTWKGKDASEGAITTVARANHGGIPSVTDEPVQVTFAGDNEETGGHHVQVPNLSHTSGNATQYKDHHFNEDSYLRGRQAAIPQEKDKHQLSGEGPKTTEEFMEILDPSLAPEVVFSPASKAPNFVKFEGMTCPVAHATSIGKAPSRTQLQSMAQGSKETFREYALRWKDLAAQVKPSLPKREMVDIFMNTLSSLYHDKLVESIYGNLENLVPAGERLENEVKKRKTAYSSTEATSIAGPEYASYSSKTFLQTPLPSPQTRKSQETPYYPKKKHVQFDPIPMSYTDLFNYLHTNKLINTRSMRPVQPPYFRGYDPSLTCAFHEGAVGHAVEDCKAFKIIVQDMIDSERIAFKPENPDITAVNGSGAEKNEEISAAADKVKAPQCGPAPMSYTALCSYLISHGWVTPRKMGPVQPPFPKGHNPEATCEFHSGAIGHSVKNCSALRHLIQGLMDSNHLTFEKGEGSSSQGLWTIKLG